jgi:hypothetical protein
MIAEMHEYKYFLRLFHITLSYVSTFALGIFESTGTTFRLELCVLRAPIACMDQWKYESHREIDATGFMLTI